MMKRAVAIVSGGLDSTTMVAVLENEGWTVDMLSFNYGQRHNIELDYAYGVAQMFGLRHNIVDLKGLADLLDSSALTSGSGVPEGHYAEETMKATVVPNRNMIMLSIACGVAVNREANTVAIGVHSGDHFIYPDCRPEFIFAAGQAMLEGNQGFHKFGAVSDDEIKALRDQFGPDAVIRFASKPITTPFLNASKADIAYRALQLNIPLHMTYSCYKGEASHCGRCGTCVERLEAIDWAQRRMMEEGRSFEPDHTVYKDPNFWRGVVEERREKERRSEYRHGGIAGGVDVPVPPELADDDSTRDDVEARAYEHEIDDHSDIY